MPSGLPARATSFSSPGRATRRASFEGPRSCRGMIASWRGRPWPQQDGGAMTGNQLSTWRVTDASTWNAFVESAPYHAFPQPWEWGEVRAMSGWGPVRLAVGRHPDEPLAGAQLLLRRMPVLGWHLAYVPRGPIGTLDEPDVRVALLRALR